MKKILLCSHTGVFRGGAERSLLLLAKYLKLNHYHVVINIPDNSDELIRELDKEEISYVRILKDEDKTSLSSLSILKKLNKLYKRFSYIFRLITFIKKEKFDSVYLNTLRTTSEFIACKITSTKAVMHLRGFDTKSNFRFKVLKYMDRFIVLNNYAKSTLLKELSSYNAKNIRVIPNGVNINEFNKKVFKNNKIKFVFIGGYEYRKGADYFLKISNELLKNENIEIIHIGENSPKDEFSKKLFFEYKDTLENPNYHEYGIRRNVSELIESFDIFIMTSRIEGMPRSLLEAMERGLIPIVSNIDELKDIIIDEKNGFIVDFNDIQNTTLKILNLVKNIEDKILISKNARADVENKYNINNTNKNIVDTLLVWK